MKSLRHEYHEEMAWTHPADHTSFIVWLIQEKIIGSIKYWFKSRQCKKHGHQWINVDTGDAENGPCFHADCNRCGISV